MLFRLRTPGGQRQAGKGLRRRQKARNNAARDPP
jgi:hypothetical protein